MTPARRTAVAAALAAAVLVLYAPVVDYGFVTFDDPEYVTANRSVQGGLDWTGVVWAFTTPHAANWHPLTWTSHMADWSLFGDWAGGHHATSVLLHALTAGTLFLALLRLTAAPWESAVAAALFALHPLRVESVAWVSERKDVLAGLGWVAAMWAYAGWAARPSALRYALVAVACAASLLAKPMAVTLPFALLLLDVWPLGRAARLGWRRMVVEKAPLFAMAIVVAVVTYRVQSSAGAVSSLEDVPLGLRMGNAVLAYATYVVKTVWPAGLAVFYPPRTTIDPAVLAASLSLLLGITGVAWRERRRRPWVAVGWCWFLGTLVPVIGLVRAGDQAMADRFTYVPSVGLGILAAWSAGALARRSPWATGASAAAALIALAVATRAQIATWRDSETLYRHALAVTGPNHLAHQNLGLLLLAEGRREDALAELDAAVAARPGAAKPHLNRGVALAALGRRDEALAEYETAVRLDPTYAVAHYNVGVELAAAGRGPEALAAYERAIALDPAYALPHVNAGLLLADEGRLAEAIAHYRRAIALDRSLVAAYNNLAVALERSGALDEAIDAYRDAVRMAPRDPRPHFNLGAALMGGGRSREAADAYRQVLRLDPTITDAYGALGDALLASGDRDGARAAYRDALRRRPDWPAVSERLATLDAAAGAAER